MIAYLLRAIVILIIMIFMVYSCLYLYEKFVKEDEKIDIYTDTNVGQVYWLCSLYSYR